MATDLSTRLTPVEYLAGERSPEARTKYEWIDGELREKNGASRAHNLIVTNLVVALGTRLVDREFDVYPGDMRVRVPEGPYYYPDVVVASAPPEFEDGHLDTLRNPFVVFEVLSPSTESIDRGEKLEGFMRIPSLTDYLVVGQDRVRVDHYHRTLGESTGEGQWTLATKASEELVLASIDCRVPVREIHHRVLAPTADA